MRKDLNLFLLPPTFVILFSYNLAQVSVVNNVVIFMYALCIEINTLPETHEKQWNTLLFIRMLLVKTNVSHSHYCYSMFTMWYAYLLFSCFTIT
jgi:hypothetical protein